jgi:hydroxymethylglutaryl-CoA reductase (NADPH)
MRWPRKNDQASIDARRAAMGLDDGLTTSIDLAQFGTAAESLVGVAVIPVSAVPIEIELGAYELSDDGAVVETGRAVETVHIPLAHTEGGLTVSMTRGALAAGTVRTHVLHDRITRASCFVCRDAADAVALGRWVDAELPAMQRWLDSSDDPSISKRARLREAKTHVVGPMCHVLWAWTTGDAVGPNMMTRNSYALNMAYVMERAPVKPERAILEANMGGDKKPSHEYFQSGHGKSVLAEAFLSDEQIRRVLRTTAEDLEALSWAGTHGAVASGMQSVAFTPASAIAAVFAATGQDLGMVGTSSMAHGTARRVPGGLQATIRFGGLEVGTVGGGTTLPSARDWLASIECAGSGTVYRFAQLVAGAALCLEISASAAMATAGSENFFKAHHERGGLR